MNNFKSTNNKTNYMKAAVTTTTRAICTALLLALITWGGHVKATGNFTLEVKNDTVVDATHFRFSVYLSARADTTVNFRTLQMTLWIDSTFVNGGVTSVTFVPNTSDMGI